ncbi:uncharacterized protein [Coffea arabica]|uniref:Uncharacterized protein isoform X1 n=1 Tax=Coffea arabica TaxID=13443 RepID=A0A6P6SQ75_COFAR|nr:uncharacterized protein LOC113693645 isoform X1 [Coffea arabica]
MEEKEQPELMLKPSSSNFVAESNSMVSATLGRVMHTLLDARPKKLQHAISNLHSPPKLAPLSISLEQSLLFLHKYVGDAAEKEGTLDEVLVPMIEHYLKFRESRHSKQAMVLLNWLFQDEVLFQALASNLAEIILRKDDHYIALGWCFLARDLIQYEISMNKLMSNGIWEKYTALLKILCSCIRHLSTLISSGSTLQGGFEVPTRLAIASADFILSLTVALTRKDLVSDYDKGKLISSNSRGRPVSLLNVDSDKEKVKVDTKALVILKDMGPKLSLWDHIDDLIVLVGRLKAWSRKSRSLHSRGLERVFKWLQATQTRYVCCQNEAGDMQMLKTGVLLLSSCWKHYGMLSHLEDCNFSRQYKGLLDEYLSGIKFYADNHAHGPAADKDSAIETIKFFMNCLSLLLGRLHEKQLETALAENGSLLSEVLISQFRCADVEVIDSAVYIFKAAIFRMQYTSSGDYNANRREMDSVLPMLIHLLDEQDSAAKAVVKLVAEYCSVRSDNCRLQNVLKGLTSGNFPQRMNAIDVISDLIDISLESSSSLSDQMWQDIADHLLECLGDEELVIRTRASALLPVIDPSLTLPALVRLIYTSNERVQSLASETLLVVLKTHKEEPEVLCLLLDCLGNLCNTSDPDATGDAQGAKLDSDRVLKLLPEWSKLVEDWNVMISALLDKLFAEPSNAVIVRSLSYISEHLADLADLVFDQLLLYTKGQNNILESVSKGESGTCQDVDSFNSLFSRLCPLLVIKLLPLKVFDNLSSPLVYGHLKESVVHDTGRLTIDDTECIGALLIDRAFNKFEFEDVRKLAAELCGRMHPHVLIPLISSQLEVAATAEDTMKIKSCLFTICTSLLVRGEDSYKHSGMSVIRKTINTILSWPSMDRNDVLKAQHGCIDCLSWMMCAELEGSKRGRSSTKDEARMIDVGLSSGDVTLESSVCNYVIGLLTANANDSVTSGLAKWNKESEAKMHISFRLCMANVLISACQKVSESGKMLLAQKILPPVICSTRAITESEIRAACNQVLFSAVYHLKSAVLPYSSDILKIALTSLTDVVEKVRITGAKLLASLMASEEAVIHNISGGLLEARTLLQTISTSDPSMEVRQLCQKLLACLTS